MEAMLGSLESVSSDDLQGDGGEQMKGDLHKNKKNYNFKENGAVERWLFYFGVLWIVEEEFIKTHDYKLKSWSDFKQARMKAHGIDVDKWKAEFGLY